MNVKPNRHRGRSVLSEDEEEEENSVDEIM